MPAPAEDEVWQRVMAQAQPSTASRSASRQHRHGTKSERSTTGDTTGNEVVFNCWSRSVMLDCGLNRVTIIDWLLQQMHSNGSVRNSDGECSSSRSSSSEITTAAGLRRRRQHHADRGPAHRRDISTRFSSKASLQLHVARSGSRRSLLGTTRAANGIGQRRSSRHRSARPVDIFAGRAATCRECVYLAVMQTTGVGDEPHHRPPTASRGRRGDELGCENSQARVAVEQTDVRKATCG